MRFRVVAAGILIGLLVAVGAASGSSRGGPTGAAMDKIWARYSQEILGMCTGAVDGKVGKVKCYGKKAPDSNAAPDVNTLFEIDSVTKTFTATLLAVRRQDGRVKSLSDPAYEYLLPGSGSTVMPKDVTLLDLADHHSGLPAEEPMSYASADDLLSAASTCLATSTCRRERPGKRFRYSNWGIATLGDLLALHDGFTDSEIGSWEVENFGLIATPLGMSHTGPGKTGPRIRRPPPTTTGTPCVSKAGDGLGFHAFVIFVEGRRRGVFLLVNNTPTVSYRTIATALLNDLPRTPGHGTPTC